MQRNSQETLESDFLSSKHGRGSYNNCMYVCMYSYVAPTVNNKVSLSLVLLLKHEYCFYGIPSKTKVSSRIPSKGSVFASFSRLTSSSLHGPYFTQVISSDDILSAAKSHSIKIECFIAVLF